MRNIASDQATVIKHSDGEITVLYGWNDIRLCAIDKSGGVYDLKFKAEKFTKRLLTKLEIPFTHAYDVSYDAGIEQYPIEGWKELK